MRVKALALASGAEAMRFADAVNAMSFDIYDGLSDAAKELAAGFCDYVQELMDLETTSRRRAVSASPRSWTLSCRISATCLASASASSSLPQMSGLKLRKWPSGPTK
jgi:hypothetical protein